MAIEVPGTAVCNAPAEPESETGAKECFQPFPLRKRLLEERPARSTLSPVSGAACTPAHPRSPRCTVKIPLASKSDLFEVAWTSEGQRWTKRDVVDADSASGTGACSVVLVKRDALQ